MNICNLINDYYTNNLEFYEQLQKTITNNINGRVCHHSVVLLNIIINLFSIDTYLEIGTHNGTSMSYVVHNNKKPITCYGIDLFESTILHYKKDNININKALDNITKNNISNSQIHLIEGNSCDDQTINKLKDKLENSKIDLLFIDGDHSYNGVKLDFMNYIKFLSIPGLVVFDDYNTRYPGIIKFCDEINTLDRYCLFKNNELVFGTKNEY